MNEAQKQYADADTTIGALMDEIDAHYANCPKPVQDAFDKIGSGAVAFGCHADGQVYHDCVFETMRIHDCCYAEQLLRDGNEKPTDCEYWKKITLTIDSKKDNQPCSNYSNR